MEDAEAIKKMLTSRGKYKPKVFYVYELREADTGKVFYVGKGKGQRVLAHRLFAKYPKTSGSKLYRKIRKLWREGRDYEYHIMFYSADEDAVFDFEKKLIAAHGLKNLKNLAEGGQGSSGYKFTDEQRARQKANSARGDAHYARRYPEAARNRKPRDIETFSRGESHRWSKLTEDTVIQIRTLAAGGGMSYKDLGKQFNISHTTIGDVVTGKSWGFLPFPGGKQRRPSLRKLTPELVTHYRERYMQGETCFAIARDAPFSKSTIHGLLSGRTWNHVPYPEGFVWRGLVAKGSGRILKRNSGSPGECAGSAGKSSAHVHSSPDRMVGPSA